MIEHVQAFGEQLRWADRIDVPSFTPADELVVCGMGGSGISGDYLAALAEIDGRRVTVSKGYTLPGWALRQRSTVLAISYSGETEETLAVVDQALRADLPLIAVTTGGSLAARAEEHGSPVVRVPEGLQPRAAMGFLLGASLRIAAALGMSEAASDLVEAAAIADELTREGSAGRTLAADLATALSGRFAVIYASSGLTAPVAMRWKTQLNENAKWPAWWSLLPELDHNELEGWAGDPTLTRRAAVLTIRDRGEADQITRRFALTRELSGAEWVGEVWSLGESALARMISLTVVGDLVSVELAASQGIDPMPVRVLEQFKERMKEED